MSKDEFASRLRSQGYEPRNEEGCIMITTGNREDFDRIREIAEASGYAGSYGWRKTTE